MSSMMSIGWLTDWMLRWWLDFGSPRLPCDKEKERDSCCDKREDHRLADGYVIVGCAEATPVEEAWGYEL